MSDDFSLDDEVLEFACPHCGHKLRQKVRWLKADGKACPACGAALQTQQFRRQIDQANQTLADFERQLRRAKFL